MSEQITTPTWPYWIHNTADDCESDKGETAIHVTMAKFNGVYFDGSPFSAMPDWLEEALKKRRIVLVAPRKDTDYAKWEVTTPHGPMFAAPGDWIIRGMHNDLAVVEEEVAYILINLRPPVEGIQENAT